MLVGSRWLDRRRSNPPCLQGEIVRVQSIYLPMSVCSSVWRLTVAFLAIVGVSVAATFEETLVEWYGPGVHLYVDEFEAQRPDLTKAEAQTLLRSLKVAAFYASVMELNSRITDLIRQEVSSEYAAQWATEAQGHILGSVDKITALQNWADNKHVQSICETGFNVGYSGINFLIASPRASFISFDIFMNRFGPYATRALQAMFPSRLITVVAGDSTATVPMFIKAHNLSCDLIFVDGGTPEDRRHDIANLKAAANRRLVSHSANRALNISVNVDSGHMDFVPSAQALHGSTLDEFRTLLIVDDVAPIDDDTNTMRQYYESFRQQGVVRTLDEHHLRYTPCVGYDININHPQQQYAFNVSDSDVCVAGWTVDGVIRKPVWKDGYFLAAEYL
jgi:hypothetical protein